MTTGRPPVSTAARILGERIRAERKALGLSQEDLADRSGVHWTFVGQVERGQRNISLSNLHKLAAGLGVDAGDLVGDDARYADVEVEAVAAERVRSGADQRKVDGAATLAELGIE